MGIETMGSYDMKSARGHSRGFTLITSLLLLLLLSGMSIGLLMLVNTEQKVGGTDLQNDVAYHDAEGGIEKMASDLAATFQNSQAPTVGQICAVNSTPPAIPGVTWTTYAVTPQGVTCPPANPNASPVASWNQISSGPNQGLWAQIIPINMQATADLLGGQEVSMMRGAQVALIPVFQFGVFCEGDCSFFSGPSFDMIGPVHTNADLYPFVGPGSTLVFHSKVEAYGNIVRTRLSNGFTGLSGTYDGDVWVSTASTNGCTSLSAPGNCTKMATPSTSSPYGDGSVQSTGGNPPAAYIPGSGTDTWTPFSTGTTNHQMINGN
jgi:Tfp pilus assembly protein PilX